MSMDIDIDELLSNKVFDGIEDEKLEVLRNFMKEVRGKSTSEMIKLLLFYGKMFSKGNHITEDQRNAIIDFMLKYLSEEDKEKFKSMLSIIGK